MVSMGEKLKALVGHRWMVFVCSMWDLSFIGTAYMFGSISPVIKSSMGYNQKQVALLSVAKDLGDNVGLLAGKISQVSPTWVIILVGVSHTVVGYGLIWLVVTHKLPSLPLWVLCFFILLGQNGTPYYNTATLVSCVQSFPEIRGPVVGILKGFIGLSGAIWTQIIAMINFSDQTSLILLVAVGPAIVSFALMFIIRPVEGYKQSRPSDKLGFLFIYSICILLAAYLLGVLLLQNMVDLDHNTMTLIGVILIILVFLPVIVPIAMVFFAQPESLEKENLLEDETNSASASLVGDDKPPMLTIGEDFTLTQALANADFWIMFLSLVLASGSGLTVINNMGQMCQSLRDNNVNVYVSVISLSNFLGRVGGGYFSEVIVRKFAYPRLFALAVLQGMMALGLAYYAVGLVGQVYVVAVTTGLGYGAHRSIAVATTSELFGLKNFGTLYNFLTIANPVGSLFLSGFVASTIYDYYAEQQAKQRSDHELLVCEGNICFSLTCGILAVVCIVAAALSLILVHKTKVLCQTLSEVSNLSKESAA